MNFAMFSSIGYLSVLLWIAVPVLWVLHHVRRPKRWLCHIALVAAVAAYVLAMINSRTYVNRIQIDRSEEIAAAQARMEKARKAAEKQREGEVAKMRFAEDDADDYLDEAGMDDADRKYMASFKDEEVVPEWKKEKKKRSETPQEDDSLVAMLDTTEKEEGMDTDEVVADAEEPIMMKEKDMMMANRLDGLNLKLIRIMMVLSLGVIVVDYLKRANSYEEAYLPLPLPSALVAGLTPVPVVRTIGGTPRRTLVEELAWLTRKGDSFVYITGDSSGSVPDVMPRLGRRLCPVDVLRLTDEISDEFAFETLWYGRSSFVVDSPERASRMLTRFLELMDERKATRARVSQAVHIVWDFDAPPPADWLAQFTKLGGATGWSLLTGAV